MSQEPHFGARLAAAREEFGPLCVGIDPHAQILADWGLSDDADGLSTFAQICLEAFAGKVAVVKPQSAFFERHGYAGIAVLEHLVGAYRAANTLVIMDAKRGDVGSTMAAYADAYLRPGAPLQVDALTVHPYLGVGSLAPAFELAASAGAGLYVLALTSNPEGPSVQCATTGTQQSVAGAVMAAVAEQNAAFSGPIKPHGVVVGATVADRLAAAQVDLADFTGSYLVPGYGAQGAQVQDIAQIFGAAAARAVVNSSRGLLRAGPNVSELVAAVTKTQADLAALG